MTALIHALFPSDTAPAKIKGEVRFVPSEERSQPHGTLGLLLTVCVPPFRSGASTGGAPVKGRLREAIESAIESALEMNEAPSAGVGDLTDLDQCLSDQLYRARSVGAGGLVIYLPHLAPACSLSGTLDAEDSAVLRWWIAAAGERPVMLLLDAKNRRLGAYGPPTPIEQWAEPRSKDEHRDLHRTHGYSDSRADSRPARTHQNSHEESEATLVSMMAEPKASPLSATVQAPPAAAAQPAAPAAVHAPPPAADHATVPTVERSFRAAERSTNERSSSVSHIDLIALPSSNGTDQRGLTSLGGSPEGAAGRSIEPPHEAPKMAQFIAAPLLAAPLLAAPLLAESGESDLGPQPAGDRVVPLFPRRESPFQKAATTFGPGYTGTTPIDWRAFANDLAIARGPKPLTFVERLFMTRYVPLMEAIARGETDDSARRTAEQWADDFARSYTEGFNALRITGKRPRMVLDAPQLANQVARLHGAKSTHLVLVDAMRFDLGLKVHDRMCEALTSQATCTERLLLWSALPTTTPMQLDLLAHGPEGLASRPPPSEQEEPIRGRTPPILRRIRLGARDLLKLDTVQGRLPEAGPALHERLDAMADDVAAVVAAHARSLPPRSLMLVFGDHGFRMESTATGTTAGSFGGASPEEVLVPAFAWLVGDVH